MANDLSINLCAYWKFDETTGTTAYDSLNTYNLAITGASINDAGKIETSYLFDAGTDKVSNDSSILWNTRMSIGAWVKSTYTAGYQNVISTYRYSTYAYGYDLNIRNSGAEFALRGGINGNRAVDVNVSGINDGNWHHVIGTWDGSTIRLYVDASLRGTNSWTYDVQYIPTCYFSIGNRAGSIPFNGNIDEPFVYNRAITPAEVSALYNNGLGLSYPFTEPPPVDLSTNLVAYWNLDETSGVNTYDSTDNNYDGSIFNSPTLGSTGILGTSYSFTKANSHYIRLGHEETLMGTSDWSFQAWINVNTLSTTFYGIAGFWNANGTWYLTKWNNDRICCRTGFGGNNIDVLSNDVITTNNWYHIVVTWDRDTSVMMYVNGILQTDMKSISAWSTTSVGGDATHPFHIGQIGNPGSYSGFYFDGRIDEVALWNRLLTQEDVTALYNNGEGLTYPFTSTLFNALATYSGFFVTYMGQTVWVFSV